MYGRVVLAVKLSQLPDRFSLGGLFVDKFGLHAAQSTLDNIETVACFAGIVHEPDVTGPQAVALDYALESARIGVVIQDRRLQGWQLARSKRDVLGHGDILADVRRCDIPRYQLDFFPEINHWERPE